MAGLNNEPLKGGEKYVPALNFDWLTPLYDPLVRWLTPESKFKTRLVERARVESGQRVLDVGCGTATLTLLVKRSHPDAEVVGLDGDAKILTIARRKAAKAEADITLLEGLAFRLPFADASFDRVFSSLMLHHLTQENKRRAVGEAFRVLRPGGELHVADFIKSNEALPSVMSEAGFVRVDEHARYRTLFGTICLWQARRP